DVNAQIDPLAGGIKDPAALLRTSVFGDVHAGRRLEEVEQVPARIARDDGELLDLADDAQRNAGRAFVAQDKQIAGLRGDGMSDDLFCRIVRLGLIQRRQGRYVHGRRAHARPPASKLSSAAGGSIPRSRDSFRSLSRLATIDGAFSSV